MNVNQYTKVKSTYLAPQIWCMKIKSQCMRGRWFLLSRLTRLGKAALPWMTRPQNINVRFFFVIDFCTCVNLFVQCKNYYIWLHT